MLTTTFILKHQEVTAKLKSMKVDAERESKIAIEELEDEIDSTIEQLTANYEQELAGEQSDHDKLTIENGILRRKIESTQEAIARVKEDVTILLHKEETYLQLLKSKEEEKNRLDAAKKSNHANLVSREEGECASMMVKSRGKTFLRYSHSNYYLFKSRGKAEKNQPPTLEESRN